MATMQLGKSEPKIFETKRWFEILMYQWYKEKNHQKKKKIQVK